MDGVFRRGTGEGAGLFQASARGSKIAGEFGFAARDAGAAEGLDLLEELVACLLTEHLAEQSAERTDVAAQRRLLGVEVECFELGEAVGPAFRGPPKKRRHRINDDMYFGEGAALRTGFTPREPSS